MTAVARPDFFAPLPEPTRRNIEFAYDRLTGAGFECYLVGGAVRDLLMGRPAGDIDLTTNARPEEVQRLFRRTIPTGLQHGTITVLLPDVKPAAATPGTSAAATESFEVTTYRAESEYSDARHPDQVNFARTLEEDLGRRDFTVNAIAFEPGRQELVDLFGGLEDLDRRLLRTIGPARERFFEDGLRPIRACRFAATLEFDIEAATEMALRNPEVQTRTARVAIERFSDEIWKGFRAPAVSRMIRRLEDSGLLYLFYNDRPARTPAATCELLDRIGPGYPALRLAHWWRDLGYTGDRANALARKLKFSNKLGRDITWMQSYFEFREQPLAAASGLLDPRGDLRLAARAWLSQLKDAYRDEATGFLDQLAPYPEGPVPITELSEMLASDPVTVRDLAVSGGDLMNLGLSGPAIGETLRWMLELVLRDPARNTTEELLAGFAARRHENKSIKSFPPGEG